MAFQGPRGRIPWAQWAWRTAAVAVAERWQSCVCAWVAHCVCACVCVCVRLCVLVCGRLCVLVCGHCWMTSILLAFARWPHNHMLKSSLPQPACTRDKFSHWQCWNCKCWVHGSRLGVLWLAFINVPLYRIQPVPQLQRKFNAEIDHNTSI